MLCRILLVDGSPERKDFLAEVIQEAGRVTAFDDPETALAAAESGLPVDMAVVQFRKRSEPLLAWLEERGIPVVAFGSPRCHPVGVYRYFIEPVVVAELLPVLQHLTVKRRLVRRAAA